MSGRPKDWAISEKEARAQEIETMQRVSDENRALRAELAAAKDRPYPEVDEFAERMRAEMIANAHKGDNWRRMLPRQAWGEIAWHLGKLTAALKAEDVPAIRELAADIANGALMLDAIVSAYDRPAVTEQGEAENHG